MISSQTLTPRFQLLLLLFTLLLERNRLCTCQASRFDHRRPPNARAPYEILELDKDDGAFVIKFIVGEEEHTIKATNSRSGTLDGRVVEVGEGEASWARFAEVALAYLGVFDPYAAPALALQLSEREEWRLESLRDRCRKHFVHGGIGILGFMDVQALLDDPTCDEIQAELIDFYIGDKEDFKELMDGRLDTRMEFVDEFREPPPEFEPY